MRNVSKFDRRLIFYGLIALLLCGCQSPTMKGTPFYTGEYEGPEEDYTDRVNLWPALYYRDPALSIFWPLFELTDNHTALRPVYSVYNKKSDKPIYNALWPIARFDTGKQSNRIFPIFWGKDSWVGDDYWIVAPLYWHLNDPFDGEGANSLFPLWIWNTDKQGRRIDLLWPIYADKKTDAKRMWRIWPLYGYDARNNGSDVSRFWAWPLGGSKKNTHIHEHYLFPLYYAGNKGLKDDLWTLLGGRSIGPDGTRWAAFPALSWGEKTESQTKNTYGLGLAGNKKTADEKASHILPLYAKRDTKDSSYFFSLLYSAATATDGSAWKASLPLFHSKTDTTGATRLITPIYASKNNPAGKNLWQCYFPLLYRNGTYDQHFMTLLGGRWRTGDNGGWLATPILSGGTQTPDGEKTVWAAGLGGNKKTADEKTSYLLPLYTKRETKDSSYFFSLPYSSASAADGSSWKASLPIFHSKTDAAGATRLITPIYASKNDSAGKNLWRCYFPLLYLDETYDNHFMTLLGGRWRTGDSSGWLATPVLSGGTKTPECEKTVWAAGLGGSKKTADEKTSYLLPLYTKREAKNSSHFFSLPYSSASAADGSSWKASLPIFHSKTDVAGATRLITPLYTSKNNPEGNNLWRCYFPLLYLDKTYDQHFMTLLGGRWRTGNNGGWLATPILSGGTQTPDYKKTIWAAGLAGKKSTTEKTSHYALPIYYNCPTENRFLSLPYLRWTGSNQTRYKVLPLLLSGTSSKGNTKKTTIAAGISGWEKQAGQLNSSHVLPLYGWGKDDYLYTLPYGKTKTTTYFATPLIGRYLDKKGGWVFPLWQHKATEKRTETNLLLGLGNRYRTETNSGHSLFPLYSKSQSQRQNYSDKSQTRYRKKFNALILLWNSQHRLADAKNFTLEERSTSGLFPLWFKRVNLPRNGKKSTTTTSLLFRLYDSRCETPRDPTEKAYTRHRVLWRVYHKETLGADSSTDIFPAITLDTKENGFRKSTFLWRLFRYEKDPETQTTKLDLFFIPLKRS